MYRLPFLTTTPFSHQRAYFRYPERDLRPTCLFMASFAHSVCSFNYKANSLTLRSHVFSSLPILKIIGGNSSRRSFKCIWHANHLLPFHFAVAQYTSTRPWLVILVYPLIVIGELKHDNIHIEALKVRRRF